jgi:hypothetical protein
MDRPAAARAMANNTNTDPDFHQTVPVDRGTAKGAFGFA